MGNFGKKSSNNRRQRPATIVPTQGTAVAAVEPAAGGRCVVDLCKGIRINRESLKMERSQPDPEKYIVKFTYDAYDAGRIVIHLCCSKPGSMVPIKDLIHSITVNSPKGRGQNFRHEFGSSFNLSSYKENGKEVFILAIQAVAFTRISDGGNTNSGTTACHYTQATFKKEEQGEFQMRVTYQSLHLNGIQYVFIDSDRNDISGRFLVFKKEIGKCRSNGTVVFEGIFEGNPVAVKRVVKGHSDVALKDIEKLGLSRQHSNVVRYYCVHEDQDFEYVTLERGVCSLDFLMCRGDLSVQPQPTIEVFENLELWKPNQHPSSVLFRLMRDTVAGLAHLHELGIIHLNLKPQNVLICQDTFVSAKISDLGFNKSSLTESTTGSGSWGWQAPELLRNERKTRAADLFSLGILLFFCITRGRHPFGDDVCERDVNIKKNVKKNMDLVNHLPEAHDLIFCLLHPNPKSRPTAAKVHNHPLFWDPETRLSFLRDASDRVDLEIRGSKLVESLESLQLYRNWNKKMDTTLITEMEGYGKYDYNSVCHLLRAIRNKLNHYPENLKAVPTGLDGFLSSRFPRLVMDVYQVLKMYGVEGELVYKYYKPG